MHALQQPLPAAAPVAASWELPEPLAVAEVRTGDDSLIILRRHGNPDGPRIVLSHGNGLAADLYFPFWSLLLERFDIIVHDYRSHGWNPSADLRTHHFPTFVWDVEYVLQGIEREFGAKSPIGVFHSMSAMTSVWHALRAGPKFGALVLFDPPFSPPNGDAHEYAIVGLEQALGARSRQRQHWFRTREEFAEVVRGASAFDRVLPGVPELFAETTLRPVADGGEGYELCCPREHEAQVFESFLDSTFELALGSFPCPLKLIGADPTVPEPFPPAVALRELAGRCGLNYDYVPETTHFLQIEKPEECVDIMLSFLARHGLV